MTNSDREQLLGDTPGHGRRKKRRAGSRHARRAFVLTLLGVIFVIVLVVTQSGMLRLVVAPRLGQLLGCQATCGRVTMSADGRLLIRDLVLSSPDIDTDAARFLSAPVLAVGLDWGKLITGKLSPTRLELRRPRIRISQGPGYSINVSSLRRMSSTTSSRVPGVEVSDGTLELGEHWPGHYDKLAEIRVKGEITPDPGNRDAVTFRLNELMDPAQRKNRGMTKPGGMNLEGRADFVVGEAELNLTNVNLAEWSRRTAPREIRGLWETMALAGSISSATLSYVKAEGITARFDLTKVEMNIPLGVENGEPRVVFATDAVGDAKLLAMRDVSGHIAFDPKGLDADLNGTIDGQMCGVRLTTEGLDFERSALSCTIFAKGFKIEEQPDLLPFAPKVVRRIFGKFSGPTAEGNGSVEITRGPPTAEGPDSLHISGTIDLRNGAARYEKFPYPVTGIEGQVLFNKDRVEIKSITGVGPTGARVVASGVVEPPTDHAGVAIDVRVTGVPLDEHFRDALLRRRGVYTTLFNEEALEGLKKAGLVRGSAEDAALQSEREALVTRMLADEATRALLAPELERINRALAAPVFDLGGVADLNIRVRREHDPKAEYRTSIDLFAEHAGILVPSFPYPTVAENVTVRIDDTLAEIDEMTLAGLTGATGTLKGRVEYSTGDSGGFVPTVTIDATNMPVDDLLIHAMPGGGKTRETGDAPTAQALIRALGVSGTVWGKADIHPAPAGSGRETAFRVDVRIDDLVARPGGGSLAIEHLSGGVVVSDEGVKTEALHGRIGESDISFDIETHGTSGLRAVIDSPAMDIEHPVEELIGVVAPARAAMLRTARAEHAPSGTVALRVDAWDQSKESGYSIKLERLQDVEFDALGGRFSLKDCAGGVVFTPGLATFEHATGNLLYNDDPAGRIALDGTLPVEKPVKSSLDFRVTEGRFESALLRSLAQRGDGELAAWMRTSDLRGQFAATAKRATDETGRTTTTGRLEPLSLALDRGGRKIMLEPITGGITFDGPRGTIDAIEATGGAGAWSFTASGDWNAAAPDAGGSSGESMKATIGLRSKGLSEDLRAALPKEAAEAIKQIDLVVNGGLSMRGGELTIARNSEHRIASAFAGTIAFSDVDMNPVLPMRDMQGTAAVEISGDGVTPPGVNLTLDASSLVLSGVHLTDAHARFVTGSEPGAFSIPVFEATAHGGVLTGRAVVSAAAASPRTGKGARGFEVYAEAGGVRFGDLMNDLKAGAPASADDKGSPEEDETAWRGLLDASLSLAGELGKPASRTGRGIVRIQGSDDHPAEVMRLPGVMPLLKLSNLQPPMGERLDFAHSEFHFDGDRVVFDELSVRSKSLSIEGDGVMRLPDMSVALRFNTRSLNRVAVLSDLLEGMRNELVTTVVSGNVYDPKFGYEQLSETKEFLDTMLPGPDRREKRRAKGENP